MSVKTRNFDSNTYTFYAPKTKRKTCHQCKEIYYPKLTQVEYKIDNLHFCSWNCKCAYKRKIEEQERKKYLRG